MNTFEIIAEDLTIYEVFVAVNLQKVLQFTLNNFERFWKAPKC